MLKVVFGVLIGGLAAWLYRSEQSRDQMWWRLAAVPAPVRQRAGSLASATARGAESSAGLVNAAPLPPRVKDRATGVARSAAEWARRRADGLTGEVPRLERPVATVVDNLVPEDILAEEDAAARASAEARAELQSGR